MKLLLIYLIYVLWLKTKEIRLSKFEEVSNHFIQQLKCINFMMKSKPDKYKSESYWQNTKLLKWLKRKNNEAKTN